jgi:hypothetical protein
MDKILETALGRWSELTFLEGSKYISDNEASKKVLERCGNYDIYSEGGVLVHMTKSEYEHLLKQ